MASRILRLSTTIGAALTLCAPPAFAQKILLQIKPHVGDTIKTHLTQTLEMSGGRSNEPVDSTKTVTMTMEVFSRAVPFQWTSGGTLIHAITDSITSTRPRKPVLPAPAVLRVASDGAIEVVDDGDPHSEIRNLFAEMPSMLPRKAVPLGDKWSEQMRIPIGDHGEGEGTVRASFRFDSLSRSGEIAFISIRGTISHFAGAALPIPGGARTSGTFTGAIQINRALGWITDAKSVITVRSEIPDEATQVARKPGRPLKIETRVSVWSRAVKQR